MWYSGIDQHKRDSVIATYGPDGPRVKHVRVAAELEHAGPSVALLMTAPGIGAVTASARVAAGKHFSTDVLAGAALGCGIGWVIPTIHPMPP